MPAEISPTTPATRCAVALQGGEVEVAVLPQVHLHPVEDGEQALPRDAERAVDERQQRARHRVRRLPVEERRDLAAPPLELRLGHRRVADLVHDVVDFAAEGVDRGDRAAPLGRQEQERVVEARAAGRGLALAVLVGRHAASGTGRSARSPSASSRARTGPGGAGTRRRRRRRCVRGCAGRPARPGAVRVRCDRRARGRAGRRCCSSRAGARHLEGHQRAPAIVDQPAGDLRFVDGEAREVVLRAGRPDPCPSRSRRPARSWSAAARCRSRRTWRGVRARRDGRARSSRRPTGFAERRQ